MVIAAGATAFAVSCALLDPFPDLAAPRPDAGGLDGTMEDDGGADDATPQVCAPKATRPCGFEQCQGVERCSAEGRWQPCDARDASVELCGTAIDESCDGVGACTGEHRWSAPLGAAEVHTTAMRTSRAGDVYITGWFLGDLKLPNGVTVVQAGSPSLADGFVIKLSRSGAVVWHRHVADAALAALAVGKNDVLVTGALEASSAVDGCGALARGPVVTLIAIRYGFDGQCRVARAFEGARSVLAAVDAFNDDAVLAGEMAGPLAFGGAPGSGADLLTPSTGADDVTGFVARLGPTLQGKVATSFVTKAMTLYALATDGLGRAALGGRFTGAFAHPTAPVYSRGYVATWDDKLSFTGYAFGTNKEDALVDPTAVTYGPDDRMYVAGTFRGSFGVANSEGIVLEATPTSTDGFLVAHTRFQATGMRFGLGGLERPVDIAIDASNAVVVVGRVSDGEASVGGAPFAAASVPAMFVAKYDAALTHLWSHFFPSAEGASANAVAIGPLGDVFVAGEFRPTIDLGGGPVAGGSFVTMRRP